MKLSNVIISVLFIVSISFSQNIFVSKDTLKYLTNPSTFPDEKDSLYIHNIDAEDKTLRIDSANNVNYIYNYDVRYYSNDSLVRSGYIGYYKDIFPGTDIFPLEIASEDTVKLVLYYLPPVTESIVTTEIRTDSIYFYNNSQNRPNVIVNVINDIPLSVYERNNIPINYSLSQNYPNPFNPTTKITYSIASVGLVEIKVFDVLGREQNILVKEYKMPGKYEVVFNAKDLPSGVYFYSIQSNIYKETKKMILLR